MKASKDRFIAFMSYVCYIYTFNLDVDLHIRSFLTCTSGQHIVSQNCWTVWKEYIAIVSMGQNISSYTVKLVCALERTLAYTYTGNGKVLSKSLMDTLHLSRSLCRCDIPTINTKLIKILVPAP